MTSCFYLEPETSNIHPGRGEGYDQNEEDEDEEGEGGGKSKGAGGRFWKLPLTACAFAISSAPLLIAEEVKGTSACCFPNYYVIIEQVQMICYVIEGLWLFGEGWLG